MDKEPMTQFGYGKITEELEFLKKTERPETVIALDEARQLGDLKENAEYHAAKDKLKLIDSQIAELSNILSKAVVIDPSTLPHKKISFGSTVLVLDIDNDEEIEYSIVGGVESNPDIGLISFNSPLAKQLLGKEEGEELTAKLPGGTKDYEILEVKYKELNF